MVDNGGNMPVLRGSWPVRRRQIRDHRAAAAPAQLPLHVVPQAAGRAFRSRARVLRSDFKWVQGEDLLTYYEATPGYRRGFKLLGKTRGSRLDPAAGARARAIRDHRQQRRSGLRPLQCSI